MKKHHGFTLLEVLVAALIMFTVLSLSALGVQSVRLSSHKSERLIKALTPVRVITMQIKQQLQAAQSETPTGEGKVQDVVYQWQATLLELKAAPVQLDPDTGVFTNSEPRFKLYEIQVTFSYDGFTTDKIYREVIW